LQFLVQSTSAAKNAITQNIPTITDADLNSIHLFPNPSQGATELVYELIKDATTSIAVYDALGNLVVNQLNKRYESKGMHRCSLQLKGLKNGVYFVQLTTNQNKQTVKLIVSN
jgi:hypothetical protein